MQYKYLLGTSNEVKRKIFNLNYFSMKNCNKKAFVIIIFIDVCSFKTL